LLGPAVLKLSASMSSAALLPSPRSSPLGGRTACVIGTSVKHASTTTSDLKYGKLSDFFITVVLSLLPAQLDFHVAGPEEAKNLAGRQSSA
jgi:hypothetical protein